MIGNQQQNENEIRQRAHEWRSVLTGPDATPDQLQRFQSWLRADARHEAAYDRAETLYEALGMLPADELGSAVLRRSWRERWPQWFFVAETGRVSSVRAGAAALALALCVALAALVAPQGEPAGSSSVVATSEFRTGVGEIRTVSLVDGTAVTIGAKSELVVSMDSDLRTVQVLRGAAYFDVASDSDRPFVVRAGELSATVVGTQFDVRHNGGVARVAVAEGEVAVRFPHIIAGQTTSLKKRATLTAGSRVAATLTEGLRDVEPVAPSAVAGWRSKRLVYAGATLAELVADAERHSALRVSVKDPDSRLSDLKITAFFDGNDVGGMIETLPAIMPVEVVKDASGAIAIQPAP